MKLSNIALSSVLLSKIMDSQGFRVGNDGNQDIMKKAVEDALFEVKPLQELPLDSESIEKCIYSPPLRNQILGTEQPCTVEYWCRPDIHTLGNIGFGGAIHAAMAPFATKLIDVKAYGGRDVRKMISHELRSQVKKAGARVIDLCCGVGISTRAIENAFHDAELIVGVDTSPEMVSMAQAISSYEVGIERALSRHNQGIRKILREGLSRNSIEEALNIDANLSSSSRKCQASYRLANAESTGFPEVSFDLVTIMYGFHEIPKEGRSRIINEAKRILRSGGCLAILDICPSYKPSPYMLAGEPFVIEYQSNIDSQLSNFPGFDKAKRKVIVPGHVNLWLLSSKGKLTKESSPKTPGL